LNDAVRVEINCIIALKADCSTLVWNLKRRIEVKPTSSRVSKFPTLVGNFKSWDTTVWDLVWVTGLRFLVQSRVSLLHRYQTSKNKVHFVETYMFFSCFRSDSCTRRCGTGWHHCSYCLLLSVSVADVAILVCNCQK